MSYHSPEHSRNRVQRELERRDHPEVAASTTQAPVETRVFACAGPHQLPFGGNDLRRDQIVAGQPMLAHQPADAATERETCHTG